METRLISIVEAVKNYAGLLRKKPIKPVVHKLKTTLQYGSQLANFGDDAAVIPWQGEYLLFAADGMMSGLLVNEPYAAGKASVMVTVNDIYSMGGRPIGLVNILASGDENQRSLIVEGIEKGCSKLKVPMIGGHLHPDVLPSTPSLSVAIIGLARKLLRSHLADTDDVLILAVDLNGQKGCHSVTSWDANSSKTSEELLYRLEALPLIAEHELACAAKDISNAGILGTIAIMLENSGKGGVIDLDAIPRPGDIPLIDWLHCFQSFGFILSVKPKQAKAVQELFAERSISSKIVGKVTANSIVTVKQGKETMQLFDFRYEEITGIRYNGCGSEIVRI